MTRLLRQLGPPSRAELQAARPGSDEGAYWRLVLWCRHVGIVVIAAVAGFLPALGEHRFLIAAGLVGLVLPYDVALDVWLRRRGSLPVVMPFVDLCLVGTVPFLSEQAWLGALPLALGAISLAPVAFGPRVAAASTIWALAMILLSGSSTRPGSEVAVGALGFAIASAMTLTSAGSIVVGERTLRRRITDLVSEIDVIIFEADLGSDGFSYLSDVVERVTGFTTDQLQNPDRWYDHVHPDDRQRVMERRDAALVRGGVHEEEYRFVRADGETIWLQDVMRIELGPDGRALRYRGVTIDVTDRRAAEAQVELYASIVENIEMALLVVRTEDSETLDVLAANPEVGSIVGGSPDSYVGRTLASVLPNLDETLRRRILRLTRGGSPFDVDRVEHLGPDQHAVYSLHAFPLPGGAVGVCLDDVTGPTMAAAALRRQALHDGLTGLPNRTLLRDRLQQALAEAHRSGDRVALLLMDLDHFKEVNDALGHQYGDRLLVELSHRLQHLLRECDTIARLGGDEFALLLTTNATGEGATRVVEKVRGALQDPFEIEGITLQSNASIGVALYPDHADNAELLTQRADVAMYTAKRGGGGWAVYSPAHDRSSIERLTLLTDLHRTLDQGGLVLHYQPVIEVASRRVVSSEALIRWPHPEYGDLDPGLVIELAELSGLILPLTRWVARQAVDRLARWREQGHDDLGVAMNLSVRNLYDRTLVGWLADLLDEHDVSPERLKVELTESQIMDDPLVAIDVLGELRAIGVSTSIDDFGTGYSSLAYLRRLPASEIKIDQSFVRGMLVGESDQTIVHTVIDLAHNLGMSVLAEGVEDDETLARLAELGCDRAQGYLIGRPAPQEDFLPNMARWHQDVSVTSAHR